MARGFLNQKLGKRNSYRAKVKREQLAVQRNKSPRPATPSHATARSIPKNQ